MIKKTIFRNDPHNFPRRKRTNPRKQNQRQATWKKSLLLQPLLPAPPSQGCAPLLRWASFTGEVDMRRRTSPAKANILHLASILFGLLVLLLRDDAAASPPPPPAGEEVCGADPDPDPDPGPAEGGGSALERARRLSPPPRGGTIGAEFEGAEFWEGHGTVLREAWAELSSSFSSSSSSLTASGGDGKGNGDGDDGEAPLPDLALGSVLDPALAAALRDAHAHPTEEAEAAVRTLWDPVLPSSSPSLSTGGGGGGGHCCGAYTAQLLSEGGIRSIRTELGRARGSGIPLRRPNGMSRHGMILDAGVDGACALPALAGLGEDLAAHLVRPVGRMLFPDRIGPGDDSGSLAFTVQYASSGGGDGDGDGDNGDGGGDAALAEHRDASVVTLNVNLNLPGETYGGSDVYLVLEEEDDADGAGEIGIGRADGRRRSRTEHEVALRPGQALVHLGSVRHGARPIGEGTRTNLVVWLFGRDGDIRVEPYPPDERLDVRERWGAPSSGEGG